MPEGIKISEITNVVETVAEAHGLQTIGVDGNGDSARVKLGDMLEANANKADKVSGSGLNNKFAALDASGNLKSSGKSASDFANATHTHTKSQITDMPTSLSGFTDDLGSSPTHTHSQYLTSSDILNKADKDGDYPGLTSGAARNLAGEQIEEAVYGVRIAGGAKSAGTGTAMLRSIMGNSVKFRQMVLNGNFSALTGGNPNNWTVGQSATITSVVNGVVSFHPTNGSGRLYQIVQGKKFYKGHVYLMSFDVNLSGHDELSDLKYGLFSGSDYFCDTNSIDAVDGWQHIDLIGECPHTTLSSEQAQVQLGRWRVTHEAGYYDNYDVKVQNVMVFDLTEMFGLNNEPNAEQFHTMFPLRYYTGSTTDSVLNNAATGIVTTGENLFNSTEGTVQVIANQTYRVGGSFTALYYSDGTQVEMELDNTFTALFTDVLTVNGSAAGSTIITVDTGSSVTFAAYTETETSLPITSIKGLSNNEGSLVVVYSDGMRSVGDDYDECSGTLAIRRIWRSDLGDFDWNYNSTYNYFYTNELSIMRDNQKHSHERNILCAEYPTFIKERSQGGFFYKNAAAVNMADDVCDDKVIGVLGTRGNMIVVKDSTYNGYSVSAFKNAVTGIKVYYVRRTPLVYTLESAMPSTYGVVKNGMELMNPSGSAAPTSAPVRYTVTYVIDAVGRLQNLNKDMVSVESFGNFCNQLAAKLGKAIGKNISITPIYSKKNDYYYYDIQITDI